MVDYDKFTFAEIEGDLRVYSVTYVDKLKIVEEKVSWQKSWQKTV